MENDILYIKNATKRIGSNVILDQVNFQVKKGEIFGLLGPNGSGKTTLIRAVVGLVQLTKGEVEISGINLKSHYEEAISHVGAIVENPEFYPYLTGYQNLVHFANMHGNITKERISRVIELVNLSDSIDDKVQTYSLGMRQRLGIAQAILHEPSLLILDEPTNGLDPAGMKELRTYLKKLSKEGNVSIIIASHLLKEVEELCDRVAIIQDGKILAVKPVREFEETALLSVYFELDRPKEGLKVVKDKMKLEISAEKDGFFMQLTKDEIPEVNRLLVQEGINVYKINSSSQSLEDMFLEVTGGTLHA
ncbi:ABC transporter ATP-binding protein [Metabacillus arenae]|uniref:ABC transporter ATP-binding protein n=1 Tax=Metabacillus arenae TaxID=2771434 RepID=A0A926S007_9BACI|nr:ABC transporter ATP-binding protein [Metabacillus arenae]MBD1379564.1 ABC transporter ATP-binding protein [Metabacillus arenae]